MRKIFSFILTIAMLFNVVAPLSVAQASTPEIVIDITAPATALKGQEVLVSVSAVVAAGTDIQGVQTDFAYSDNFPEFIEDKFTITENTLKWSYADINSVNLVSYGDINTDGGTVSGQIVFKIPENAAFDTVYTVSLDFVEVMALSGILDNSRISVTNPSASVKVVPLPPVEGITVEGYEGEYDGDEHTISVDIPDGATIKYSEDGDTYSLDLPPTFKNAGEHTVYYVVSKEGNSDTYGSGKVSIKPKALDNSMIDAVSPQQYTGSQIKPDITVTDGSPSIITTDDYTVSYGDNVNVKTGGSITITGKGNYTGSAVADFDILPITMEVTKEDYEGIYDGNAHTAQVDITKPLNADVKYGTQEGTYTLDAMPQYTDAGTYTIYYKATAENYSDYTGSVKVIIKPKTLTEGMVGDILSYDYTGSQIKPDVTVNDESPCIITQNDYEVSYGTNVNVLDGGKVIIKGKGNYTGTVEKDFVINPIAMTVSALDYNGVYDGDFHSGTLNVEVPDTATVSYGTTEGNYTESVMPSYKNVSENTVYYKVTDPNYIDNTGSFQVVITPKSLEDSMLSDIPDMPYTGEQITPSVTVTDGNPSIITTDDYTVSYGENLTVTGGGNVTITGKGNYTGSISKPFNITPIEMTVQASKYEGVFDGENHSATVSVTTPSNAVVRYGLTEGAYDMDTMPTFRDKGEYTVYYKATAENYIDNTGSVLVKIAPKPVTVDMISNIDSYPYTGSQITPVVTVSDGEPNIITENDYTISYGENLTVADGGSVTITGKGNYTGTATKNFAITPIDMTFNAVPYQGVYDGLSHSVSVTVTEPANAVITYGTQEGTYDLQTPPEFKNVVNSQVYYKITADNYNDVTGVLNVDIEPKALTNEMLESITAQEYTGSQITPSVTLRDTPPCEITENDCTVAYGENITVAGGGSVTVTGKGNYIGEITKTFEIANAVLRTEETDYEGVYDGSAYSASLTVTNCDTATVLYGFEEGTYDLSQMPVFTNAGNYVVYYKATAENYSDCTGSLDVVITPKELTDEMVSDISSYTYTSAQITPAVTVTDGEPSIITNEDFDVVYGENLGVVNGGTVTVNAKRNYTGTVTKTFEITKADLNITSESKEITYGDAFSIPVNYSGFVGSETKANLISEAVVTGFSESPDAGIYDIILSGAQSDNYNIIYGTDYTLTVNKKNISLTSINVFDKAYDETTDAVINETSAVLDGVISGDVVLVDLSLASANFASAQVGDGISVEITGLAINGEDAGNYTLINDTYTTTASIKPAITAADIAAQITSIVIDRNTTNLVLPVVPDGFVISLKSSSDEAVVDLNGVIYTGDTDAPVDLVFTVTSEDGTDFADTMAITATVPAHDKYQITVTAQSNGSVSGDGLYVKNTSATITATADSGYKFDGWYSGDILVSSNAIYTFTVTEELSLVAKFSAASSGGGGTSTNYTVKFVVNGGTDVKNIRVSKNKKIGKLPVPEREGYTFEGWYTDQALTKLFDADSTITKAITLYAKWEKKASLPEEEKPTDHESAFSDVNETAWYYDAVKYVVEKGLFKGISDTEFAPNSPLTRGMLVTVLYRAEQQPQIKYEKSFDDVSEGNYYSNAVIWAAKNGIVSGISDNEFMPDNNISREQIATIIYRYAKYKGIDNLIASQVEYVDKMQISDWAADAIAFCKSMSIMTGNDVNEFMPRANATRAEVAATLQRFFKAE